jgi:hypothetical protein
LKILWVDSGGYALTNNIRKQLIKNLKTADISITECPLDDIRGNIDDEYDYYIVSVNRADLVQEIYNEISKESQLRVIDFISTHSEKCDWKVKNPCGFHHLNFNGLLTPVVEDGIIVDLK